MENMTGEGLMTLTMTRELFPHFKRMLESTPFIVGDDEVMVEVRESLGGVITLWTTTRRLSPTT